MKYLIIILLIAFLYSDGYSIPAFARKYNMSCGTCHSPFPKLKAYGSEFAGNGFMLADQDAPRYFVETGDPELNLLRDLPIAIRLEAMVTHNIGNSDRPDFSAPYILKLLSGGAISKSVAYYFYFFFSERGDVAGVEDAFIMFNNVFPSVDFDIYLGQFQTSDPLFKRELRLTFEDYQIYRTTPGLSRGNLTYDRGLMLTLGLETGTEVVFEILNGTGLNSVNNFKQFDEDKYKNFLGRISQDIGEYLRIGGFAYYGKEKLLNNINEFLAWGPDMTISFKDKAQLNLQYVKREDKNPGIVMPDESFMQNVKTDGAFAELVITPLGDESKWYGAGLFNWVQSDQKELDYKSSALQVGYLINRNVRAAVEFNYNFTGKFGQTSVGVITAF